MRLPTARINVKKKMSKKKCLPSQTSYEMLTTIKVLDDFLLLDCNILESS